jgi:hypothetical protein
MFLVWTLHGGKKHGAKNDLPAEQRGLSPETDFEKMRPTASRNLTRRVVPEMTSFCKKNASQLQATEKERK